jgi:hypothetical protein
MAVYIDFYCNHCDTELVDDTSITSIGTTHIICPNCSKGNRTKASPFSYKNTWGKFFTFIEAFVNLKFLVFWFVPSLAVPYFTLKEPFDLENNSDNIIYIIAIGFIIAIPLKLFFLFKKINEVEIRQKEIEKQLNIKPA